MCNTETVLPIGAKVRIVYVDSDGLWGREYHPDESDVGVVGTVLSAEMEDQDTGSVKAAIPGTVFISDEELVIYTVRIINDETRILELANYEVALV